MAPCPHCSIDRFDAKKLGVKSVKRRPKISKLTTPLAIERGYQKTIRNKVNQARDILKGIIVPNLPQLVTSNKALRPREDGHYDIGDDVGQKIAELYGATRLEVEATLTQIELNRLAQQISTETSGWNKKQIHLVFRQALGIDLFFSEPWLAEQLKIFAINNANLITNVSNQFIDQTEQIVFEGMRKGLRHEEIAKQIIGKRGATDELGKVSRYHSAITRANLIARDQINKLNGNLNHLRQVEAGIKDYFWRDSNDKRVRAKHRGFNGNRFSWKKGAPGGIHPGDEIQCRCWPEPVFSNLFI